MERSPRLGSWGPSAGFEHEAVFDNCIEKSFRVSTIAGLVIDRAPRINEMVKLQRANGGCLGAKSRRRA